MRLATANLSQDFGIKVRFQATRTLLYPVTYPLECPRNAWIMKESTLHTASYNCKPTLNFSNTKHTLLLSLGSGSDTNTFNSKFESAPAPNPQVYTSSGSNMNISMAFNTSTTTSASTPLPSHRPFTSRPSLDRYEFGDYTPTSSASVGVMIPECVRWLMFGTEGSRFAICTEFSFQMALEAGAGEALQIQPQSQSQLYRHNCSLNANRHTNCTLNLNLNHTSYDNDSIHHIALRQNSLLNPRSRNSTRNLDPDRPSCFLSLRLNRPKLPLRNKLRRRGRVKRGNMIKVNIIIINPQAVPVVEWKWGWGRGRWTCVQGDRAHMQTQFQTWPQGQAQCKANLVFKCDRKHTKVMHKPKNIHRYDHILSF
ncbi:hypothetical protein BU17DRAFT_70818 [Hysterangium stoloniferum]|nr:hypothetical protein BU17DRAFT_70818 [Hysterangium stoloniferum]